MNFIMADAAAVVVIKTKKSNSCFEGNQTNFYNECFCDFEQFALIMTKSRSLNCDVVKCLNCWLFNSGKCCALQPD